MEDDLRDLHPVYQQIAQQLGEQTAWQLYELFRGQQITFPMRLYDPRAVQSRVTAEYDGTNLRQLARRYGYSEKTIRRFLGLSKNCDKDSND